MNLDSDDLEELLRQNLNLRRQLGAQIAKAKDSALDPYSLKTSKPAQGAARWSTASIQDVAPFESGRFPPEPMSAFPRQGGKWAPGSTVGAAKAALDNSELEGLRRELTVRRLVAAEIPEAEASAGNQSGERPLNSEEPAEAVSDDEDLAELRRQLRLRRELGTEIAETKESSASPGDRITYSAGWVLHGTCFAVAGLSALLMLRLTGQWRFADETVVAAVISAFAFYGLGRDFLYALSGR